MEKIWITGTGGLIGNQLAIQAKTRLPQLTVVALNRQTLDLTNFDLVSQRFEIETPSLLIHCAAISNSQQCEREPDKARLVNTDVTTFLAGLFAQRKMIFFSTDLVFDGRQGNYVETEAVNPLGWYARTKVEAELSVLQHSQNMVVRTSINGGISPRGNRGFNEVLVNSWKRRETTRLFQDEYRCPIPAAVTARAVLELIQANATGIFHVAGSRRLSRLETGRLIAGRHPELHPNIESGSIMDFKGGLRAANCSLNCDKAQSLLGFDLPGLDEWLRANPDEPF